ncbi:MAG: N-formylglutamate amidohydrolase [Rhodospirillales bacterium]|nr:N-formylglutamate amidohydrolase [Alphaproteobacteria bacterium]MCB9977658.1 N-formylglutamate amidohydrolase [Rhodospirillales bacterium]
MLDQFTHNSAGEPPVSGPEPVTIVNRDSPVIFTGPHNGVAVLDHPEKPLGMGREWFERAHEACDLNMQALFETMIPRFPNASFLWGNYSRLVADVNRMPDFAIACESSEWTDLMIPGNALETVTPEERERRMNSVYWPYHDALTALIGEKREKFGGVLLVDLHSFTPFWQNLPRDVEVGLLTLDEHHPLATISSEFLREKNPFRYKHGEPYFLPARLTITAAPLIQERNSVDYLGFEVRNNMIASEEGRERFCDFFDQYVRFATAHPNYNLLFTTQSFKAEAPAQQDLQR